MTQIDIAQIIGGITTLDGAQQVFEKTEAWANPYCPCPLWIEDN